ncbi:glycosyltransferase family 4 protein [Stappia sp.]|uniref:glycosyltransferase family 4 protein n=1 Tax=Stappia sp. TaxID=1870903 RepID=UPI003A99D07E
MREIFIDIGRLVRRLNRTTPTGVDRVVLAYERGLRARFGDRVVRVDTLAGRVLRYPPDFADEAMYATQAIWAGTAAAGDRPTRAAALAAVLRGTLSRPREAPGVDGRPLFFCLDHRGLERGGTVERLGRAGAADPVCLLHDVIPLTHPEYVVPAQIPRHATRVRTMAAHARLVIANSGDTAARFAEAVADFGLAQPETITAPLGIEADWVPVEPAARNGRPRFVVLGTIEARKNHLLLLNLWRKLAERYRDGRLGLSEMPELVIVGRRGWEAEAAFDMLDRAPALKGHVREVAGMGDADLRGLLASARALLFPSFAEGFGLPLAEALAMGVPAVVSDIPAFREVGGTVPDFLDPLDGLGWQQAVIDYARPDAPRRAAQIARLAHYRPPGWETHLDLVCARLGLD